MQVGCRFVYKLFWEKRRGWGAHKKKRLFSALSRFPSAKVFGTLLAHGTTSGGCPGDTTADDDARDADGWRRVDNFAAHVGADGDGTRRW